MFTKIKNALNPRSKSNRKGFTMVEAIIAIATVAVLTVLLTPTVISYIERTREQKDIVATTSIVDAVRKAIEIDTIYDEVENYTVKNNVSCYIDSPQEGEHDDARVSEDTRYSFTDEARQADATPYYAAGCMYGVTITFKPEYISDQAVYVIENGIVNGFSPRRNTKLPNLPQLYDMVLSAVDSNMMQVSSTYENSEYTIFIALSEEGEKVEVYGQYNGTNLLKNEPSNNGSTTDRTDMNGDAITNNPSWVECTHSATTVRKEKAATCVSAGYTGDTYCLVCNEKLSAGTRIEPSGHGATEVRNQKVATCASEGYTGDTYCTLCKKKISSGETTPASGHGTLELRNKKDPTCVLAGYSGDSYCSLCNTKVATGNVVPSTGHTQTTTKNQKSATCDSAGFTGDTHCVTCDLKISPGSSIPATGHTYRAPKWTWNGYESAVATFTCVTCGGGKKDLNAEITSSTATASCTSGIQKTYTASVTFDSLTYTDDKKEDVGATGHDYQVVRSTASTCVDNGSQTYECSNCGDSYVETAAALGHDYDAGTVTTQPGCNTTGVKTYKCKRTGCNNTKTESIAVLGHEYAAATCDSASKCSRCGGTSGNALGHDWNGGTVTKESTCTATGVKTYTCKRTGCTGTKTEDIAKKTHSYASATCTTASKCTVCGATTGSAKGHTYGQASWSWSGYTSATASIKCSACGDTKSGSTTTITSSKSGNTKTYTAKVTLVGKEYTGTKDEAGRTASSAIAIASYIKYTGGGYSSWRVLFNNSGQIDLVSANSVTDVSLSGADGYTKAVQILNGVAQNYINTNQFATAARSIGCTSSSNSTIGIGNEYYYLDTGSPNTDTHYTTDVNQLKTHGLVQTDKEVWLASRLATIDYQWISFPWGGGYDTPYYSWGEVRSLQVGGGLDDWKLRGYGPTDVVAQNSKTVTHGFRPVVSLKGGLYVKSGSGTSSDPYVLTTVQFASEG